MGNTTDSSNRFFVKGHLKFRKAESDLEYMTRRLDDEFGEGLQNDRQLNPGKLTQRLQQVKKDYNSLVMEAQEIKQLQAQVCDSFKSQLQATCTALLSLQTAAPDAQVTDSLEQQALVESLLNMSLPKLTSDGTTATEEASFDTGNEENLDKINHKTDQLETTGDVCSPPKGKSQGELRAESKDFIEIAEEEFTSVSSLVRGRVALGDVNKVYRVLFRHFKEDGNTEMLSVQDMSKMGLRITGTTGEAKLKVLRSLKLLQISRTGSVLLL